MKSGKLAVSFYGPFVSLLDRDPVEIYSPRCFGHQTGIFTTDNEAPLERDHTEGMNKVFHVSKSGIQPYKGKIAHISGIKLLSPPEHYTLTSQPRLAWFCIRLPKPTQVVGISPHEATITGTDAPEGTIWATGLRLIFDYDMDQPDFELSHSKVVVFPTKLKDHCHDDKPGHFEVTVRSVGPLLNDPDHEDASACFEASTRLFESKRVPLDWDMKPVRKWRLGSDCGSAHLVRF